MTDYLKDIFQAWGDRIRSPFFGSTLISFCLINWKALFYVFLAEKPVRMRILYFEHNTDWTSLFVLPLISGLILALILPWASFAGAWMARLPRSKLHVIQNLEASKRRISEFEQEAKEQEAKARLEEASERRKIDSAKRLEEAGRISSGLKNEISNNRGVSNDFDYSEMSEKERWEFDELVIKILDGLSASPEGLTAFQQDKIAFAGVPEKVISIGLHRRNRRRAENAFKFLESNKYVVASGKADPNTDRWTEYEITDLGYKKNDEIKLATKQPAPTNHTPPLPQPRP